MPQPPNPRPRYDPASTYFISAHYLPPLLCRLIAPLGYDAPPSRLQLLRRLTLAWLPVRDGKVQFQEVLFALSRLQVALRHAVPPATATPAPVPAKNRQPTPLSKFSHLQVGQILPPCELRKQLDKGARAKLELRELRGEEIVWNAHEYFAAEFITKVCAVPISSHTGSVRSVDSTHSCTRCTAASARATSCTLHGSDESRRSAPRRRTSCHRRSCSR